MLWTKHTNGSRIKRWNVDTVHCTNNSNVCLAITTTGKTDTHSHFWGGTWVGTSHGKPNSGLGGLFDSFGCGTRATRITSGPWCWIDRHGTALIHIGNCIWFQVMKHATGRKNANRFMRTSHGEQHGFQVVVFSRTTNHNTTRIKFKRWTYQLTQRLSTFVFICYFKSALDCLSRCCHCNFYHFNVDLVIRQVHFVTFCRNKRHFLSTSPRQIIVVRKGIIIWFCQWQNIVPLRRTANTGTYCTITNVIFTACDGIVRQFVLKPNTKTRHCLGNWRWFIV